MSGTGQASEISGVTDVEIYVLRFPGITAIKEFRDLCSDEVRTYMGILLACIKKRDKKAVKRILDYFLNENNKQVVVSKDIDFDDISHIKDGMRDDVVWYLWKLLITNVTKTKEEREFCRCHLYMYALYFQKKYRNVRINLLYFCYLFFASGKKLASKKVKLLGTGLKKKKSSTDYLTRIVYRQSSIE